MVPLARWVQLALREPRGLARQGRLVLRGLREILETPDRLDRLGLVSLALLVPSG